MNLNRLKVDILALALLAAAVFAGLSLSSYDPLDPPSTLVTPARESVKNWCGLPGALFAHLAWNGLGLAAYVAWAALVIWDLRLLSRKSTNDPLLRLFGVVLVVQGSAIWFQWALPDWKNSPVLGSGGYLGALALHALEGHFSPIGLSILTTSLIVSGLILSSDGFVFQIIWLMISSPLALWPSWSTKKDSFDRILEESLPKPNEDDFVPSTEPMTNRETRDLIKLADDGEQDSEQEQEIPVLKPPPVVRTPVQVNRSIPRPVVDPLPQASALPPIEIFETAEEFPYELLAQKARSAAAILEKTFVEFGMKVRVVEIDTGPVITQFEIELEAGLRLSKVSALADDLAIALRVSSVRVVAPIPGKNTVGIEVPNDKQVMVRIRELLESCQQDIQQKRIPIFLGKDVSGRPMVVDLTKLPHLLIAGRTGTGKSVCLNALILSILATRTPQDVRLLLIDPKMVELSPYSRIPHLMHPVITDMKKAEAVLGWAVDKMEERYDILARCGVRHLDSYNKLGRDEVLKRLRIDPDSIEAHEIPEKMPYIVIIADEMADMMMTSGKEVEGHIIRLAQKSRAVGIHLVLATQKPTVDVITGLIKSNLPARISFQVASRVDSRVVLDEMGADKLLGNGDMLFLVPGTSHLLRAQGTYVSDEEVNEVIGFYGDQPPQYSQELAELSARGALGKGGLDALKSRDEFYEQAIDIVVREGRGSVSLLQRCLGIGYGRAARLIDYMAEDGIVGDYNGSQAREVLYTPEQWESLVHGEPAGHV